MPLYYSPSGKTSSNNMVSAYLILLAIAYFTAIAYTIVEIASPIVYISWAFPVIFSFILFYCTWIIGKLFKLRSKKEFIRLGLFSSFFGWFFSWAIYGAMALEGFEGGINFNLHTDIIFNPAGFFLTYW